ncbi:MAG: hypothetical protein KME16_12355 [Scytolyngbya sp. HA4215-MV1]|jgi:hypothetical protein|nr:hypothetical protein [Scytolyngbya sp. HA4215-MV1]
MGSIFGFIKSLFGGIFGFIGGIFGSKKAKEDSTADSKQAKKKNSGYFLELDDARSVSTTVAAPAEKASAEPVTAVASPAPAKADPKPAPAKADPLNLPVPTVTNFATNYLVQGDRNGRRRPGANMNYFLGMARQVNPSR